jgi:hypothetical protein
MSSPHRLAMMTIVAAAALCMASCSRLFVIVPAGRADKSVAFHFYEFSDHLKPLKLKVNSFFVQKYDANHLAPAAFPWLTS